MRSSIVDSTTLAKRLHEGSAALFPTDTLPALAASPMYASQLWDLKKRSRDRPFILMAARTEELLRWVHPIALKDAWGMAMRHWPGALTMVLPASGQIVNFLNPGSTSIGMRIPACDMARSLLIESGPLATTSANLSGEKPCKEAHEASSCFPELPILGPIPWPQPCGQPSTVINWQGNGCWQVLRSGAVIPEFL